MKWWRRWRQRLRRGRIFVQGSLWIIPDILRVPLDDRAELVVKTLISRELMREAEDNEQLAGLIADNVRASVYQVLRKELCT